MFRRRHVNTAIFCFTFSLVALFLHRPFSITLGELSHSESSNERKLTDPISIVHSEGAITVNNHDPMPQVSIHTDVHKLKTRVDSNVIEDYAKAVADGNQFFCFMEMTKKAAEAWIKGTPDWNFQLDSAFNDPTEAAIEKWGWRADIDLEDLDYRSEIKEELFPFMKDLKLEPGSDKAWASQEWRHAWDWVAGGKKGQPIKQAVYRNYITKDQGNIAMIVDMMFSPRTLVKAKKSPGPTPDLGRASDMWFLQYYRHGVEFFDFPSMSVPASRIKGPKHIFIQHIVTPQVKALLERLVMLDGTPEPDGKKFVLGSEEARMLMGTAHGQSVGWFLIQHKDYFGDLEVKSIRIWFSKKRWNLYFEIGEVVKEDQVEDAVARAKL